MTERPIYQGLAELARDAGFSDVTPSRVHRWVRERLLPPTGRQVPAGRAGFYTERSAEAEAQLLALCAWRKQTKQLDALAVLLWMDDWVVPLPRIRRSLRGFAPAMPSPPRTRTERAALRVEREISVLPFLDIETSATLHPEGSLGLDVTVRNHSSHPGTRVTVTAMSEPWHRHDPLGDADDPHGIVRERHRTAPTPRPPLKRPSAPRTAQRHLGRWKVRGHLPVKCARTQALRSSRARTG